MTKRADYDADNPEHVLKSYRAWAGDKADENSAVSIIGWDKRYRHAKIIMAFNAMSVDDRLELLMWTSLRSIL